MNYQAPHDEWEERIIAKFAGDLDPSEVAALDNHVRSCPQCAREMEEYALLVRWLHMTESDEPEPQLPPIMQALKQEIAQQRILEESQRIVEEAFRIHRSSEVDVSLESGKRQEEITYSSTSKTTLFEERKRKEEQKEDSRKIREYRQVQERMVAIRSLVLREVALEDEERRKKEEQEEAARKMREQRQRNRDEIPPGTFHISPLASSTESNEIPAGTFCLPM